MDARADYDDLLTAIYEAGEGRCSVGVMLAGAARRLDALMAGFLVYDDAGQRVTHSIVAPSHVVSDDWSKRLGDMNQDPGIRVLSRMRLGEPRRFTDLVPGSRLRSAGWFRRQEALAGIGYGMAVDLDLAGLRVRMFGMRAAGTPDFESGPLELLGRIGRHIERAFAPAAHRLAPHRLGQDAETLVFRPEIFAGAMREEEPRERRLAERFGLTPAEARVALAAAGGLSRADTAKQLGITLNSLKTHLRRIHSKLGVSRAAALVQVVVAAEFSRGLPSQRQQ